VLWAASSIPISACIFAFSLGPAPEKTFTVPAVLDQIAKKDMPKRREALRYLGIHKTHAALPALEHIVRDESEAMDLRGDALRAIHVIDPSRGHELALALDARTDSLGSVAKELAEN
jgi:FAD/FMN-containing dehydrogenase